MFGKRMCADRLLGIDQFASTVKFKLPGGKSNHGTLLGLCLTLILVITVLMYALIRVDKLQSNATIISSVETNYFDVNNILSTDEGMAFGFAITSFDGSAESIEDPLYGTMMAKQVSWGFDESSSDIIYEDLPLKNCTND